MLIFILFCFLLIALDAVGTLIMISLPGLQQSGVYAYNLTENDTLEGQLLALCIDWKIENTSCGEIYGSIQNDNGEPIR